MINKYPNFFVVGAMKAGTTALARYLSEHPEVYMSPIKEPHYFSSDLRLKNFSNSYKRYSRAVFDINKYIKKNKLTLHHIAYVEQQFQYAELFREVKEEKAIGEASTGYLFSKTASRKIYQEVPHAKIIIILRDPVERAISHYKMARAAGKATRPFLSEFIHDTDTDVQGWTFNQLYCELGLYTEQIKRYLDVFPKENIRIYFYDNWCRDNLSTLNDLAIFLGISKFKIECEKVYNASDMLYPPQPKLMKHPEVMRARQVLLRILPGWMFKSVKNCIKKVCYKPFDVKLAQPDWEKVLSYFIDDIEHLEILLDIDLTHWKKSRVLSTF